MFLEEFKENASATFFPSCIQTRKNNKRDLVQDEKDNWGITNIQRCISLQDLALERMNTSIGSGLQNGVKDWYPSH
jgi:hypothetical protein